MLITTLCRSTAVRFSIFHSVPRGHIFRTLSNDSRHSVTQSARRKTLKETLLKPPGDNAYGLGRGAVAGGAVVGMGALCYYGLGLSNDVGAIDKAAIWPSYVKDRIRTTYLYFAGSLAVSIASANVVFKTPMLLNLVTRRGWMAMLAVYAVIMAAGITTQSMEYSSGFGPKQVAWLVHSALFGGILAPIRFLGGPIMVKAAAYTAGIVGGLTTIAICAPSEQFLTMGGPLAMGLGLVFASSLAGMFLPPTTMIGAGLHSFSMYGGLLLFSGFMMYDTQRIVKQAEMYPMHGIRPYDPINAAMAIYMDTLNIFLRVAMMLAQGGGRDRRK